MNVSNKKNLNISKIEFSQVITNDSYSYWCVDNTFITFHSFKNNILYLIYSNVNNSIILYNLEKKQKINEIKNSHKEIITNFRHYFDENNKRDLFLSISMNDNNIRLWNLYSLDCLVNLYNINYKGFLCSAHFLNENKILYIITSHISFDTGISEPIKIYDLKGKKINEIKDSNEPTYFIDIYYENNNKESLIYIISGNRGFVKSYFYNKNNLYKKYYDHKENKYDNDSLNTYESIVINKNEKNVKLICCCRLGKIMIWDFHSGLLLNKITIDDNSRCFNSICLWDEDYIFVGCDDNSIKIINLNNGIIIKSLVSHYKSVSTLKIINHSQFGKCLLSQGDDEDHIILWRI